MTTLLPEEFECPECEAWMEEEDEGKFWCGNCQVGLGFYIEDGELYAEEY